jgi:hypothetical protein
VFPKTTLQQRFGDFLRFAACGFADCPTVCPVPDIKEAAAGHGPNAAGTAWSSLAFLNFFAHTRWKIPQICGPQKRF